jgi:hypothetical protein
MFSNFDGSTSLVIMSLLRKENYHVLDILYILIYVNTKIECFNQSCYSKSSLVAN